MPSTTETTAADVLRHVEDGVARITLNRPDAGNAMTSAMRDQIAAWVQDASADLSVRVVVITGAGDKAFCTGADLRGMNTSATPAARRCAGRRHGRRGEDHPQRLAAARRLHPRLRKAGHRRGQRNGSGRRHAPGPGVRSGGGRRGGEVHRGLRPAGHRPRRRRRMAAGPAGRDPEGQGAVLLR